MPRRPSPALWSFLALVTAADVRGESRDTARGLVVEEVARASASERAGIRPGDFIVAWTRGGAEGAFASPFDLLEVEVEQLPRGPITLAGRRGDGAMAWTLPPAPYGLAVRPALDTDTLAAYEEGARLVESKKFSEGAARWSAAAEAAQQPLVGAWLLSRAAKALAGARIWAEADAAYERAVGRADESGSPTATAHLLRQWADTLRGRSDWAPAEDRYRRALALDQKRPAESLAVALTLNNLGILEMFRGDLDRAERYLREALAIRERLAPGSLVVAATVNNLGSVTWHRGDLTGAEEQFLRTLEIEGSTVPDSVDVAMTLSNLGVVARGRGDFARAEDFHRRSLAIREKLAPGSLDVAASLKNLGVVARRRGETATAEDYYRRALAIEEALAPGSPSLARSLGNLANVLNDRGDPAAAEAVARRGLEIEENVAPGGSTVTSLLGTLGDIARRRGDAATAEDYYRRALAATEKLAPASLRVALELHNLGAIARERGDLGSAEKSHRRALEIREKLAPGTTEQAESLHELGLVYQRQGRREAAVESFLRALDALESQNARLGGTEEVRSSFAAGYGGYYHDAIETLVDLGRAAEALHVLERSRARSLLALLAERDLAFSADLSPELRRERNRADAEYDRVQARIARLDPTKDEAAIEKAFGQLRELRATQEGIVSRIRKASPHFASLHYPDPLDLAGVRAALDPGTLLLSYSVGSEGTVLFAVQPAEVPGPGLFVSRLAVGEKALREKVAALRQAAQRPVPRRKAGLAAQATELYELLVRPVEPYVLASDRVALSLSGPLHSLPFAALVRKAPGGGAGRYLAESKPLHVVASATVYAELKKARRASTRSEGRLAAFGDPRYPPLSKDEAGRIENPDVRAVSQTFGLTPLPFTREEVDRIARLFPDRTESYIGERATEERAKALGADVRYVHFACHGFLDERFPLNSSLALTIPARPAEGQDNGLLQAWEIFDKVRIDADLVTLSACSTALGREMGGEGLVGLTRAFHYAGARSVLATLWGVSDASTPLLMQRFYAHLKAGMTRDRALQAAQVEFIRGRAAASGAVVSDLSHPFRWAAFQRSGDWR